MNKVEQRSCKVLSKNMAVSCIMIKGSQIVIEKRKLENENRRKVATYYP